MSESYYRLNLFFRVSSLFKYLNPFHSWESEKINTPWGSLSPSADIFPITYLLIIYGLVYILPFGRDVVGMSWFDWCRSEDGPLE